MKLYILDGSPDEITKVLERIQPIVGTIKHGVEAQQVNEECLPEVDNSEDKKFVSAVVAKRILSRRELSKPMKAVLKALYEAGDEWIPSIKLYEVSGYTSSQFAGLMGAFGRRIGHTEGYDEGAYFFDYKWNEENGALDYRLPESVRSAIEATASI